MFPQIDFYYYPLNKTQGAALISFMSQIVDRNIESWEQHVVDSGCVKEVRIWWIGKCVDIVLKPGSKWGLEWNCGTGVDEGVEARELKLKLGFGGRKIVEWKSKVVVGSIEG